jgi:hypothetical protein
VLSLLAQELNQRIKISLLGISKQTELSCREMLPFDLERKLITKKQTDNN